MALSEGRLEKFQEYLGVIKARQEKLTDWELSFCSDQEERFAKYGADMSLSVKQWAILDRIYEKLTDI